MIRTLSAAILAMGIAALMLMAGSPSVLAPSAVASGSPSALPTAMAGGLPSAASSGVAGGTVAVAIRDFLFDPAELTVAVGTTVTWTNEGASQHTATADDRSFDSGVLPTGASFAHRFDQAGTWTYLCLIHPDMRATITVVPGVGSPAASPSPAALPSPSISAAASQGPAG